MERRRFLNLLFVVLGSTAAGSFAYSLLRYLLPPGKKEKISEIILKKSEIASGEAKDIIINSTPAIIINRLGKGFIALSRVCTHLGCLVEYDKVKKRMVCPCHAGTFDLEGNVISGPPPKPLPRFPLIVEGENIIIG